MGCSKAEGQEKCQPDRNAKSRRNLNESAKSVSKADMQSPRRPPSCALGLQIRASTNGRKRREAPEQSVASLNGMGPERTANEQQLLHERRRPWAGYSDAVKLIVERTTFFLPPK